MKKIIISGLLAAGLTLGASAAGASAYGGETPNPKAVENCIANIMKQTEKGVTGAATGNAKDPKQLETAVTNCDHFWQNIGAIGG